MNISFAPLISGIWLYSFIAIIFIAYAIYLYANGRTKILRGILSVSLILAALNPVIIKSKSDALKDIIPIIIDKTASMQAANRIKQSAIALETLKAQLINKGLEPIVFENKTIINDALADINNNIDLKRLGAIIYIGDGIDNVSNPPKVPFHQIIIGEKAEFDPYLSLIGAPFNSEINSEAKIRLKLIDKSNQSKYATLNIYNEDGIIEKRTIETNKEIIVNLPITKRGENNFAFETEVQKNEISSANNAVTLKINGETDRLRVLLVTGVPNEGTRAWRELLKSDPNIDMVHFTILRSYEKLDNVPDEELSLIPFPIDDLFDKKLEKFDLVIFDRFKKLDALPEYYINRIKEYVINGGAFLMLAGPDEANSQGVMNTPLKDILPLSSVNSYNTSEFKPELSIIGKSHPITKILSDAPLNWGKWQGLNNANTLGKTIMETKGKPVFIIDEKEKGRVAVFLSDTPWLWQRGYDNGGPFRELFKRSLHWLMKDPKLDELQTIIEADGNNLELKLYGINSNINFKLNNQSFKTKTKEDYEYAKLENLPYGLNTLNINGKNYYINIGNNETFGDLSAQEININGSKIYTKTGNLNPFNFEYKKNHQSAIISQTTQSLIDNRLMAFIIAALIFLVWFTESRIMRQIWVRKPRQKSL